VSQSKLEVNTGSRRDARENLCERVMVSFSFTSLVIGVGALSDLAGGGGGGGGAPLAQKIYTIPECVIVEIGCTRTKKLS